MNNEIKKNTQKRRWGWQAINLIVALTLVLTALGAINTTGVMADSKDPKVDPNLLQLATEHPDFVFPVIVQKELKNKDLKDDEPEDSRGKSQRQGQPREEDGLHRQLLGGADRQGDRETGQEPQGALGLAGCAAFLIGTARLRHHRQGDHSHRIRVRQYGRSMAVQADGKILVAGISSNGTDNDFALARYNTDGSLDTSFSGDGKLTIGFGFGHDEANSVTVQSDGKILVAGTSYNGTAFLYTLLRFNSDGSLDTTFDTDGKVTTAVGTKKNDLGQSVIVQSNGKILVAGQSYNGSNDDFALARYNSQRQSRYDF